MWDVCFENSRVSRKARIFSDHFPLFLEAGSFLWGPSPFRFCNSWLVSSDSNQIIVETVSNSNFQGWAGFILHEQLRSVKLAVKAWNIAAQAKVKKKTEKSLMSKLEKYDSVAELIGLNQEELNSRAALQAELLSIYQNEERNFIQKSKLNWLSLGDENTGFFHRFLNAKKRRNLITELKDDDGVVSTSFRDIERLVLEFFESLYTRIPGDRFIPINSNWSCVSSIQNEALVTQFSVEEIFKALKALGNNKAPSPDGFTVKFLITQWSIFKDIFKSLMSDFHRNGRLDACIQENFICLVQKKENVTLVKDFRPISLTTLAYKVVAKVLSERLKQVMDAIISPTQSAFIEGRQILDPILIANEAVEDYRAKRKKGWILKLDLEKAFDRVNWNFLEKNLSLKKFSSKWASWIMGCLKIPKYSIFINGKPRGRITASRGIRQGDPLSPFLFLLVSEVLGEIINKLHINSQFEGFLVGKDLIHLPLLQFVDDTLLFCMYDVKMLLKL